MKIKYILFIAAFFIPISLLAICLLSFPAKKFSENENRPLSQIPTATLQEIEDGDFQSGFENFIGDQTPLRETGISASTAIQKFFGKTEINGIYLGKDNYYFNRFTDESYSKSYMNTVFSTIDSFIKRQPVPFNIMLIPSSGTVLNDKLPKNSAYYNADIVFKTASKYFDHSFIDLRKNFLENKDKEQLYYHTDHHWTTDCAYLAYKEYCHHINISPKEKKSFGIEKISDNFHGTLYSKILDSSAIKDTVSIPKNIPDVKIIYDGKRTVTSPYDLEFLNKKDKYSVFFGGNYGTIEIETPTKNGKRLLVIKDSFANSFVPFLFSNYEKIVMLDLRYCNLSAKDIIKKSAITDILFLYEMSNLLSDKHIFNLTQFEDCIVSPQKENFTKPKKKTSFKNISDINKLFIGDSRAIGLAECTKMNKTDFFASIGMTVYKSLKDRVSVPDVGKVTLEECLNAKKYDIIYLMLGINELGYPIENNINAFEKLLKTCSKSQPQAKIIIMANIHVTKIRSHSDKYINNKSINNFNSKIAEYSDHKTIFYLDSNHLFDDSDGNLSSDKCSDSAHLKSQYYANWGKWIIKKSRKILQNKGG